MTKEEMARARNRSRFERLLQNLSLNKLKINEKHADAASCGRTEYMKPSLFRKVTKWFEQIAGLEEKEKEILSEITRIERNHQNMRQTKKLRPIAPAPEEFKEEEPKPKRSNWFWWLLLFLLMEDSKRQHRPTH